MRLLLILFTLLFLSPSVQSAHLPVPASELRAALASGDEDRIRTELAAGRIGEIPKEQLPLWAYKEASLRVLKESGISLLARDPWGMTPLHIATQNGEVAAVRYLIDSGFSVNHKDDEGRTPLYFSSGNITADVAKLLLSRGAYIDARGRDGITPLIFAAQEGSEAVFSLLLSAGANSRIKDGSGKTVRDHLVTPEARGYVSREALIRMRKELDRSSATR